MVKEIFNDLDRELRRSDFQNRVQFAEWFSQQPSVLAKTKSNGYFISSITWQQFHREDASELNKNRVERAFLKSHVP